jgi:hypothetical protein
MPPGTIPLTAQKLPMNPDGRLALQKPDSMRHTLCRGNAETQVDMIGHGVALYQLHTLLLAPCAPHRPHTPSELPIEHTTSVLWDKNSVRLAVPSDVRWALPFSHRDLLSSERGGSLKGGLYDIAVHDGTAEPLGVSPPEAVAYPV